MTVSNVTKDDVRERVEESYTRSWNPRTLMESAYPSDVTSDDMPFTILEKDLLTAEEAAAAEEQLLGKRGMPHDDKCSAGKFKGGLCSCSAGQVSDLNDDVPDFLYTAAKAGPPLDALGRTDKERKERKIADAIALGEKKITQLPMLTGIEKPKRAVTVMRDHDLTYPDLYMAVYVVPDWDVDEDEARFARWMHRSGCYRADTIEEADLVIFSGGSDVEPLLYGEKNETRHPSTYYNIERDNADMKIYLQARSQGTPIMGVCRGAQFLHVMNGGKLYQHIEGHNGGHKAFALREKLLIENVSSVHHQSCVFQKDMEVLLTANQSSVRYFDKDRKDTSAKIDVEAFYYRDTGCFGVQGHPEYSGFNKFSIWCLEQLNNLFLCSPDFVWEGKRLRMTPAARDAKKIAEQYIENAYNQSKEA